MDQLNQKQISYHLMMVVFCAISLTSIQLVNADAALLSSVQKLKISDVLSIPSYVGTIKVELHGSQVKPGDQVAAKNFIDLNLAKISWDVNNYDARHTLILLDLDRKSSSAQFQNNNHTNTIYNQFTSINIPGNLINGGQSIVAFDPPVVPCQPTNKHRILILAFHQAQNIDINDVAYMSASSGHSPRRENFKFDDFITKHRLELVAANVFLAVGENNSICSGSSTINNYSLQSFSLILIAMVIAIGVCGLPQGRKLEL